MTQVPEASRGLEQHIDPASDNVVLTTIYGTQITSGWQDTHDPDVQLAGDWLAVYAADGKQTFCISAEDFTCMDTMTVQRTLLAFMRAVAGLPPRV
jgi:hypothetical protein